jgi:hypothetical protein
MAKKPRNPKDERHESFDPEPEPQSEDVKDALGVVADIRYLIEEKFDADVIKRGGDFFTEVLGKAKSIGKTIRSSNRVTENQRAALDNILSGVKKWDHEDDDDDED